jgi:hypothetical protein
MNKAFEVSMEEFNEMAPKDQIAALCGYHECSEKKRKVHFDDYVRRRWNPHPPQRFVTWWYAGGHRETERKTDRSWSVHVEGVYKPIDAVAAFNCQAVRDVYSEAKEHGLA